MLSFTREHEGLMKPEAPLAVHGTGGGSGRGGIDPMGKAPNMPEASEAGAKARLSNPGKLRKESSRRKSTNPSKQQRQARKPDHKIDYEIYPENPCAHGSLFFLGNCKGLYLVSSPPVL